MKSVVKENYAIWEKVRKVFLTDKEWDEFSKVSEKINKNNKVEVYLYNLIWRFLNDIQFLQLKNDMNLLGIESLENRRLWKEEDFNIEDFLDK